MLDSGTVVDTQTRLLTFAEFESLPIPPSGGTNCIAAATVVLADIGVVAQPCWDADEHDYFLGAPSPVTQLCPYGSVNAISVSASSP